MRLTWLGHATVLIELDGVRLLTDPVLRRRVLHLRRAGAVPVAAAGQPDAVLVSHLHWDHLDLPTLELFDRGTRVVVPAGGGGLLRRRGFDMIEEVTEGTEVSVGPLTVRATHAEHAPNRGPVGAKAAALGYLVHGTQSVYFAGDTDLFGGMSSLCERLDVALVPISGWGPTLPPGHLDAAGAAEAVRRLRPRVAIPIHFGTYWPMNRRTPMAPDAASTFAARVRELAPQVNVRVLSLGTSCTV